MLLNQEIVKIKNLQLAAKLVSEQVALGLHRSRRTGVGVEFEQYRHYVAGDDPKRIDWKLFARTGKHQIKESTSESQLTVTMLLDLSGSMNYAESDFTRLQIAKILLASLGYMAYIQNDNVQLGVIQKGEISLLVPAGKQAFRNVLYQLENLKAGGKLDFSNINNGVIATKQKELIVVVSDLFSDDLDFANEIKSWAMPGKEIIVLQLLGQKELDPDFKEMHRFRDLETGKELELSAGNIREKYKVSFQNYLSEIGKVLTDKHIHYSRFTFDTPVAEILTQTLSKIKWSF